jgi:hypothetical protein
MIEMTDWEMEREGLERQKGTIYERRETCKGVLMTKWSVGCDKRRTYWASLKVAIPRNVDVRGRRPMLAPGLLDLKRSVSDPSE